MRSSIVCSLSVVAVAAVGTLAASVLMETPYADWELKHIALALLVSWAVGMLCVLLYLAPGTEEER